jgi:hypothetical protein
MLAIDILKWPGMNAAFLASLIGSIVLTLVIIPIGRRRPVGKPISWGEAMLAAVYAFGVLFLAFGIVPHQWIDHADKDLGWSKDNIIYGPGDILKPQEFGGWLPLTLHYQVLRDTVVVLLHVLYFGLFIWVWHWWQSRGKVTSTEVATSTYGRPLVRKT